MKVYSSISGRWFDSTPYLAADRLMKLRNTKGMWDVIDEVVKIWYTLHPRKWRAHLIEVEEEKETRKNKWASTKDKSLRYTLDIPEPVIMIIRKLYTPEECSMDKKWMLKFAKRYKKFVVAQSV